jgi:hypothetical protein
MSVSDVAKNCPVNSASHWLQSLKCASNQPSNTTIAHVGYQLGYWFLPALLAVAVIVFIAVTVRRNSRNRDRRLAREIA